jgi:uncharacterized membrane protein YdjX (TVP38/TMEM64 family)
MSRFWRPAAAIAVFALVVIGVRASGVYDSLTVEGMRRLTAPYGSFAPAVFVAVCILATVLNMPAGMVLAIGAMLFGAVRGFVYGWVGVVAGATLSFLSVRHLARDAVARRLGLRFRRFRELDERLAEHGFRMVLLLRIVLFVAPPLNFAIGATSVSLRSYVAGTALGILPGLAATVYLGDSLAAARSYADLMTPPVLVPVALLLALAIAAAVVGRRILGGPPEA